MKEVDNRWNVGWKIFFYLKVNEYTREAKKSTFSGVKEMNENRSQIGDDLSI